MFRGVFFLWPRVTAGWLANRLRERLGPPKKPGERPKGQTKSGLVNEVRKREPGFTRLALGSSGMNTSVYS